jgi:Transposase DDE domain
MKSSSAEIVAEIGNWAVLRRFLPLGWEEQARLSGALKRTRGVSGAEALLRTLLIHLANGCSLAETSVRAKQAGLCAMSSVALFKRLRAAEGWLRWLAQQVRGVSLRSAIGVQRRLRAVDATTVSEPGSTGTDWRIHYSVNLGDLQCDFFELTDVKGGETLRRVPIKPHDIMMGDRIYATPPGVAHVLDAHGDLVVRVNRQSLPLFDEDGNSLNVLKTVRGLKPGQPREWRTSVQHPEGGWLRGRLIAVRRSIAATRMERRRLMRRASRRQYKVSKESLEAAQYFMVWTSLPDSFTGPVVLDFYRIRWQIELVFKRMKSIMGLGHLPKADPVSCRAWLHGKLFVALLVERMIAAANSFSPWGYELETAPQSVEGI